MAPTVFLSHSSADADAARELRRALEAAGYGCWMAPDDVDGTDSWAEQILAAIERCEAMLVLISANANRSAHVSREVNLALGRRRPVFPVRIENVPPEASLEYLLSLVQRVDAFPPPITDHAPKIIRRLEATLRKSGRAPSETTPVGSSSTPTQPGPIAGPPAAAAGWPPPPPPMQLSADGEPAPLPLVVPPADGGPPPPPPLTLPAGGGLAAGIQVGAFTVESRLGEGGMATVYRATQSEPRRPVALKVIRADHAADPVYRKRFLAEKDTLAALEHPGIVPIYAAGEAGGVLYIAMRLVDGVDLAGRIEREGRLSLKDTVAVLRPIADAVDYAHDSGVVHRDLKPSNIILDRHGRPYLTDFGLGKQLEKSQGLSAPGIALGTLTYMAPEQFTGLADPALAGRIDIYALACVAYACLTGSPPFAGDTPERLMYAHLHEQLPNRPDLPDQVETVLRRALAKNPADRYATAADLIAALATAAAITEQQTASVAIAGGGRGGGIGAWARANRALASAGLAGAALVIVGTGVLVLAKPTLPTSTSGPANTQAAGGPSAAPEPTSSISPSALAPSVGPAATPPLITVAPTVLPTRTPTPNPTPTTKPKDTSPPTGGAIRINDGAAYTTAGSVTVNVTTKPTDAQSGIARYVWATSNSRPSSGSKVYDAEFGATIPTGDHGTRTIYVWFQNGDGVWSSTAVTDTITFDHKPVSTGYTYDYQFSSDATWCTASSVYLTVVGYAATDPDGNSTLSLIDVWQGTTHFSLGPNSRTQFTFTNPKPENPASYTFSFKVEDDDGATTTGTLTFKSGPCPPGS